MRAAGACIFREGGKVFIFNYSIIYIDILKT